MENFYKNDSNHINLFCGQAFITFRTEQQKIDYLERYQ